MTTKVAIITGSRGGIGAATAQVFAKNGYRVFGTDLLGEIQTGSRDNVYYPCDLKDPNRVEALFGVCRDMFGRLDVLVTAHGVHSSVKCHRAQVTDYDLIMDTNVKAVFFCNREALRLMTEGVIINVGSSVGIAADKDAPLYSTSKAAVHHLTRCLAQEYGRRVRVNAIAPGPVNTPMLWKAFGNDPLLVAAYRRMALRGIAQPDEVAQVILFMASDTCKFMNGAIVPFDGGESILYAGEPAK